MRGQIQSCYARISTSAQFDLPQEAGGIRPSSESGFDENQHGGFLWEGRMNETTGGREINACEGNCDPTQSSNSIGSAADASAMGAWDTQEKGSHGATLFRNPRR